MCRVSVCVLALVLALARALDLMIDPKDLYGATVTETASGSLSAKCVSCTYVSKGIYYQSDANGYITTQFYCDSSPAAGKFCAKATMTSFPAVTSPDALSVCRAKRLPVSCINSSVAVTLWGDERTDPSFITLDRTVEPQYMTFESGAARDINPLAYASLIMYRGQFVPNIPKTMNSWGPDVWAYYGTDVLATLVGMNSQHYLPNPNNPTDFSNRYSYPHQPIFQNYNNRLLIYQGHVMMEVSTSFGGCVSCAFKKFYTFLTTHGRVNTKRMIVGPPKTQPRNYNLELYVLGRTADDYNAAQTAIKNAFGTLNKDNEVQTFGSLELGTTWTNRKMKIVTADGSFAKIPAPVTETGSTILMLVMHIFWADDLLSYPFFMLSVPSVDESRATGILTYAMESVDLTSWTVHPDSVTAAMVPLLDAKDWAGAFSYLYRASPTVCESPSKACYVPIGPSAPSKKYLRVITLFAQGQLRDPMYGTGGDFSAGQPALYAYIPNAVLYAETLDTVNVYVVPSLSAGIDVNQAGYQACQSVPGCVLLDPGFKRYPSDGVLPGSGSAAMRAYFDNTVLPTVFGGCNTVISDPVKAFLAAPAIKPSTCYRMQSSPMKSTCYTYTASPRASSDTPLIFTDTLRTTVVYTYKGVDLTITQGPLTTSYPVPVAILGAPFTPSNLNPVAYVYNTPVPGSYRYQNYYVTTSETCVAGAAAGTMTANPSCTCHPYPFTATACLCSNNYRTYKITGGIPAGLTFTYPSFFTPRAIPRNYTLTNSRTSFDSNVFVSVQVDCPTFLCSSNADCASALRQSNYLTFCENQRAILENTLNNLADDVTKMGKSVNAFLDKNAVPPEVRMIDIAPLAGSGVGAGVPSSVAASLAAYNTKAVTSVGQFAGFSGTTGYTGYNTKPPLTLPWQACGISMWPYSGVATMVGKVNSVAMAVNNNIARANYIATQIDVLASKLVEGFAATYNIAVKLADAHNQVVNQINDVVAQQSIINSNVASALSWVSLQTNVAIKRLNFLDLVGARAATLGVQSAAIMTQALDQASRARIFAQRVDACAAPGASSAALCAGSDSGTLLSVMIRQVGTVSIIDAIVMEPVDSITVYAAVEFCYNGFHYSVPSGDYVFVLVNNVMMVTTTALYDPQPITSDNTRVMQSCPNPVLVLNDITPGINVVPISTVVSTLLIDSIANLSQLTRFDPLPVITATVNITGDLARLNQTITDLSNFTVEKLVFVDPPTLYLGQTTTFWAGVSGLIFGSLGLLASSGAGIALVALAAKKAKRALAAVRRSRGVPLGAAEYFSLEDETPPPEVPPRDYPGADEDGADEDGEDE